MSARDAIFLRLRKALDVGNDDVLRQSAVSDRLTKAPIGIIPARGRLPEAERLALFAAMAEKASASIARINNIDDLPGEVANFLKSRNLPASIRMGDDPLLAKANWDKERQLDIRKGASDGHDLAGLSHAFAAIAESGTLVLASGGGNPTTINFLPEHHIVVVRQQDVLGDMESALARIRENYGQGQMPRAVNMITGPSRSGDIEQTIILGAHGPRALHIVLLA